MRARSWQGWQIPLTHRRRAWRGAHRRASTASKIVDGFERGEIAVVAGFQGIHAPTAAG